MSKFISIFVNVLAILLISFTAFSQNLIQNSGFETDKTKWNTFWSRDGVGSANIVTSPVHSGNKAIKIDYPGIQDWSFQTVDRIQVIPGQLYEISCWVLSIDISNEADFSVILYDSQNNVLNWTYSPCKFDKSSTEYKKYTSRFIIPENVKTILPRLVGSGIGSFYADDVLLTLIDLPGISGNFALENDQLKVEVGLPMLSLKLTNKTSSKTYQTRWAQFAMVKSVNRLNDQSISVASEMINEAKSPVNIEFTLEGKAIKIKISGESRSAMNSDIQFPGLIASQSSDFMIVPRGTGMILPVTKPNPFGNFTTYNWKSTMPFVGITNMKDGYMVASDDQWDAEFTFEKPVNQNFYSFQLHQKPSKTIFGYYRTVYIVLVDNGYIEMCNWYRDHAEKLGYVKTLRQKKAENPNIEKLIGAVDFWPIAWKLNSLFLDSLKLLGIDKAIWHLTGSWGNHNFAQIIDSINAKGFLSGRYDIFTDVWPPDHPTWIWYRNEGYPEDVIVDSNGQLKKGWLAYQDNQPFQGYYTCAETHLAYAKKHVPEDLSTNRYNSRFIDVELSSSLVECYSPVHPVSRKEDAAARNRLLSYIKNDLKLVTGVEEAHDFAFQNADYGEGTMTMQPAKNSGYDWSTPIDQVDKTYIDYNLKPMLRIPLHGLVYHDVHLPTWYTGDGASKVPSGWDDKNLWNILYGTMPLYMPPSWKYWKANFEKFISGYHYISAITRSVGYEKMIDHQFLSEGWKIQKTSFENGWNVVANFDSIPHSWSNINLAAKGFYATDGKKYEVSKTIVNGHELGWAFTGNRLFFNPYGVEVAMKGVRTSQPVFIQNFDNYLLLSFVGTQDYVDLNIAEIPFEIAEIKNVTEYYSGSTVSLTNLADGWKRLSRPSGKCFFKLYYSSKTTGYSLKSSDSGIKIFPNPAKNQITILRPESLGEGRLTICNLRGQELIKQSGPGTEIKIDIASLSSGLYFINFIQDKTSEVLKFIKQ